MNIGDIVLIFRYRVNGVVKYVSANGGHVYELPEMVFTELGIKIPPTITLKVWVDV